MNIPSQNNIRSYEEICKYFFSLEDHHNFKIQNKINNSKKTLSWEWILNKSAIWLYWTRHELNDKDEQYEFLEKRFNEFYNKYKNEKVIILSEWWIRDLLEYDTKKTSIKAFWEPWFLARLARTYKINIASPEPDIHEEIRILSDHFDHFAVLYYFVWRNIYWKLKTWWSLEKSDKRSKEYISKLNPWKNINFSDLHHVVFPDQPYTNLSWEWLEPFMNPLTPELSIINKISAWEDELIRDPYIIQQIIQRNKKWYNIFLIYWRDHLIKRQPLLKYWESL